LCLSMSNCKGLSYGYDTTKEAYDDASPRCGWCGNSFTEEEAGARHRMIYVRPLSKTFRLCSDMCSEKFRVGLLLPLLGKKSKIQCALEEL